MRTPRENLGGAAFLLCGALLPGCKAVDKALGLDFVDFPGSRLENLDRLHTPSGKHHYAVDFVGDLEYEFNRTGRTVGGLRLGKKSSNDPTSGPKESLADPSENCYELLQELFAFESDDDLRLSSMQITWAARILQDDPSPLSRELAALALGPHGRRIGIEGPTFLRVDVPRADADMTAALLTPVIANWRSLRQGAPASDSLRDSLEELRGTTFDLAGTRRVLPALAGLMAGGEPGQAGYDELAATVLDFQRRAVEYSLWEAYDRRQPSSRVRAAAVTASVEAGGRTMLARFVGSTLAAERRFGRERDGELLVAILRLVAEEGLPEALEGIEPGEFESLQEEWLGQIVAVAVEDYDSQVRVQAMKALARVTDGPSSLREEDWEEWYYQRAVRRRAEAGLPPALDAVESTDPSPAEESGSEDGAP